ncbi:MAG: hypothetical protein K0Q49_2338 [Haloplasmataceae bacterium]|nr:hypothetical protein [Haloplasmataceae bacterium]
MTCKLITGIKEIHQFMKDEGNFLLPFAPAFLRLLQSLNAPNYMNYDFVMCVSGASTRLSWQQGWAAYEGEPNQSELFVNGDRLTEYRKGFEGDQAIPVLAHGIDSPTCLIMGYENDGEKLDILHLFIPDEKKVGETKYMISSENWQDQITMYCIINSFTPRIINKQLLVEIMENVIYLAKLENYGSTALGINAIQTLAEHLVWDEGFEKLEPKEKYEGELSWHYERPKSYYREDGARNLHERFWAGYCDFLCMLNGFNALWQFMNKYKDIVPEWIEDLQEASVCARRVCDYTGELWQYVSADELGLLKFKTKDVRSIFAAHMLRAKIYTKRIIEIFERLLKE